MSPILSPAGAAIVNEVHTGPLMAWRSYLQSMLEIPVLAGPEPPGQPGRHVIITSAGGPGLFLDGALDRISIQAESVGEPFDIDSAEQVALTLDALFLSMERYEPLPGVWILGMARFGAPPSSLRVDEADRHRFVASYVLTIESNLTKEG